MVGLATDSAIIIRGVHTGAATQLKKQNSALISMHCMAHRLCSARANNVATIAWWPTPATTGGLIPMSTWEVLILNIFISM